MTTKEERDQALEMIGKAWGTCPELRLGQLIVNAAARYSEVPLFYMESLNLAGCVAELCQTCNKSSNADKGIEGGESK
jgi:hypothetical protein